MAGKRRPGQAPTTGARPRGGASWVDERKSERGDMRVMQGLSTLRADAAYEAAQQCDDCARERVEQDDESALCDAHLAHAMGMNSEWP